MSFPQGRDIPPLTDIGVMCTVDAQTARVGSELGLWLRRI